MQLYNTLSRRPESVDTGQRVTVYVCGITPYDTTHLGHAFLYVVFDVLIRYFESKGAEVAYTQNVTDIDDDILRKSRELGMYYLDLARRETDRFLHDLQALNVRMPDHYPRATQEIEPIIKMIRGLVEGGHAYVREGNVYFDLDSYPSYGELSGLDRTEMLEIARERGGDPDDPLRDDPLDFLLWKASLPGEPRWPSPWSDGRPGWHIECSAMALCYLGESITIHGGGADLIYPHHESERAQSESYTGVTPFVRGWMHVGMLRYQGEKMSKSLGNLVLVGDLLRTYTPDAIRLALLAHHYRESWEYEDAMMQAAQTLADRLTRAAELESGDGPALDPTSRRQQFEEALESDLYTPGAVSALEWLAADVETASSEGQDVQPAQTALVEMSSILGLTLRSAVPESVAG